MTYLCLTDMPSMNPSGLFRLDHTTFTGTFVANAFDQEGFLNLSVT